MLFKRLQEVQQSCPLAQFLCKLRLLPLGRTAILSLGRLTANAFKAEDLHLPPIKRKNSKRRSPAIIPNVFRELPVSAIREFLRACKDSGFFRSKLLAIGCPVDTRFGIRTFARLAESLLYDYENNTLIEIANFRGLAPRWPAEILSTGGACFTSLHRQDAVSPKGTLRKRISSKRPLPVADRFAKSYRTAVRDRSQIDGDEFFYFPEMPVEIAHKDREACLILKELFKLRAETNQPRSDTAFSKYLQQVVFVLSHESKRKRIRRIGPETKQALRLIKAVRMRLKMEPASPNLAHGNALKKPLLNLNLIPIRFVEKMLLDRLPDPANTPISTGRVILLEALFSGRRISDFGEITLGSFQDFCDVSDMTLRRTKIHSVRMLPIPQSRLLPKIVNDYVADWHAYALVRYSKETTLFEIITGNRRVVGSPLESVRTALDPYLIAQTNNSMTRLHLLRYTFGTWSPVAALLAWYPHLTSHSSLHPWTKDSLFFSDSQLEAWRELTACPLASVLEAPRKLLAHTSERELRQTYCISWHLQMLIHALIRAERLMH